MKNFIAIFFLTILGSTVILAQGNTLNAKKMVDVTGSTVDWTGMKVTGKHTGTIKLKSGDLIFTNGILSGGTFVMDMGTISCTDLEGDYAQKLVGHLTSDDFFSVEKYPEAKLIVKKVTPLADPGAYHILADLTIKGITKETNFNVNIQPQGSMIQVNCQVIIDRTKFDIKYGSGSFFENLGDKAIDNNFELKVSLLAK